jgi:Chs5-Arf1p-binding protein BUD7/BCH1
MQKAQTDLQHSGGSDGKGGVVIHEDGTVVPRDPAPHTPASEDDDDASTRAIVSPTRIASAKASHENLNGSPEVNSAIPTIRISTESDRAREDDVSDPSPDPAPNGRPNGLSEHDSLEKPVQAAAAASDSAEQVGSDPSPQEAFSFSNKRLCERWLDNLFMVLYEVCR